MHRNSRITRFGLAAAVASLLSLGGAALSASPAGAALSVVKTVSVGAGPHDIEALGNSIWTADNAGNTLTQIDATTGAVVSTITIDSSVGVGPNDIAIDATHIWVTFDSTQVVAEYDWNGTNVWTTGVGNNPDGVASDGTFVYVANGADDNLSKIRISTGAFETKVAMPSGSCPDEIATSPDKAFLFISGTCDNSLIRLKLADSSVDSLPVGTTPDGVATDGSFVWVANEDDNTVSKISLISGSVVATLAVGTTPKDIAVADGKVWVANSGADSVTVIDAATDAVLATVPVGGSPADVAFANGSAWVANGSDDTVSQISDLTPATTTTTAPVTTTTSGPQLANTGSSTTISLLAGAAALLSGSLLLGLAQRRRQRSSR